MIISIPRIGLVFWIALGFATISCILALLWLVVVAGAVSFGALLRPEWQNWLILILYGFLPVVIGTAGMRLSLRHRATIQGIGYTSLVPTALVLSVLVLQLDLWSL